MSHGITPRPRPVGALLLDDVARRCADLRAAGRTPAFVVLGAGAYREIEWEFRAPDGDGGPVLTLFGLPVVVLRSLAIAFQVVGPPDEEARR